MMAVQDSRELLADLGAVRAGASGFITNLFASPAQLAHWASCGTLQRLDAPGCVIVLRGDCDFQHLYFAASSPAALSEALAPERLDNGVALTCDVVARPVDMETLLAPLRVRGFVPRATLARMTRPGTPCDVGSTFPPAGVEVAQPEAAAEVRAFLDRLLDRYAEQIPDDQEIRAVSGRGGVLLHRVDGAVGGLLMFDRHGRSAHLRYWWIDGAYRDRGVGSRLMRAFLHECRDVRRIVLWVVADNADSIAKYEHYGFRRDGLIDQIMFRPGSEAK